MLHPVKVATVSVQREICLTVEMRVGLDHLEWETVLEGNYVLDPLDLLIGQDDTNGFDVVLKVRNFSATHDGEHIWVLGETISKRDTCNAEAAEIFLTDLVQSSRDVLFRLGKGATTATKRTL